MISKSILEDTSKEDVKLDTEFEKKVRDVAQKIRALTPDAYLKANLSVSYAAMAMEQALDKMFRKYGLSHKRFLMLHILMENGGSMTMPELTQKMYVSRQAIALTVRFFEEKGIVTISDTRDNHRIKQITLTEKGLELVNEISMSEYRMHVHNIIMSVVNEREAAMLTDILDSLAIKLSTIMEKE